jgi:spermidine/putrescine transport system substrate-binding protein
MPHPRERRPFDLELNRRDFLKKSAGAAFALSGASAILAACGKGTPAPIGSQPPGTGASSTPSGLLLARPDHPVKWPIYPDNKAIADGLQPEQNATLKLYNWSDYVYKKVVNDFGKKYNCKVELSTFNNMDEAIAKIRTGQVDFDILWPTVDVLGKLIQSKYIRPLNHSYIPNITNVWQEFQNPFYDQGWQYSTPYVVYTTGIAWRVDHVSDDVATMSNPYDIFWNTKYKGKIEILDDYREGISMVLLKHGIKDLNTCDPAQLQMVAQDLSTLSSTTNPLVNVQDYVDLPTGKTWINQAWSGDVVNSQYYGPKGFDPGVLRYWYQPQVAPTFNDCIVSLTSGKNPVLSHLFLNYMLDYHNAMENFSWVGYQPPQTKVTADLLIKEQLIPKNLTTSVVPESIWQTGSRELELDPTCDSNWHNVWEQFKAGH